MSSDKSGTPDSSHSSSPVPADGTTSGPGHSGTAVGAGERHLPYLLAGALQRLRVELTASIPVDLRVSHMRVLEELDRGSADRPSGFAPILGMTKAGAGKVCDQLEEAGLVESVTDPADARVRRLRTTAAGRAVRTQSDRAIDDLERRWAAEIGPAAYQGLRSTLARLVSTVAPTET